MFLDRCQLSQTDVWVRDSIQNLIKIPDFCLKNACREQKQKKGHGGLGKMPEITGSQHKSSDTVMPRSLDDVAPVWAECGSPHIDRGDPGARGLSHGVAPCCRLVSSITGIYALDARVRTHTHTNTHTHSHVSNKNVSRNCKMSPGGGQHYPQGGTTGISKQSP